MTRRGVLDAASIVAVGIGWGLLAPATKGLLSGIAILIGALATTLVALPARGTRAAHA
jgi:hypothetical protein